MVVIKNVLILIAMEAEAAPLIKHLGLSAVASDDTGTFIPCQFYTGLYKDTVITVATNGKCLRFGVDNVGTGKSGISQV
jgi:5'-methylthioadenosine nucleosidase